MSGFGTVKDAAIPLVFAISAFGLAKLLTSNSKSKNNDNNDEEKQSPFPKESEIIKKIIETHKAQFGFVPDMIVRSPGRINVIGEHTDYSNGFVMPAAINRACWIGISKNTSSPGKLKIHSIDYNASWEGIFNDSSLTPTSLRGNWASYPLGVTKIMNERFPLPSGINLTITGTVPQGAGLSSSAALEIATAFAIQQLFGLATITGPELAKIGQQAEHEYAGVKCGIMDQFISRMGRRNNALLIDCKTLEFRLVPMDMGNAVFVIVNSNAPHKLEASKYNERVAECAKAVQVLSTIHPGNTLREFSLADLKKVETALDAVSYKRALHVISENQRVLQMEQVLAKGNHEQAGKLMNESHESLKTNYEVSSPELDWLTSTARTIPGVYGSRLIGAGFGGCVLTLIEKSSVQQLRDSLDAYKSKFGLNAEIYESGVTDGSSVVWVRK